MFPFASSNNLSENRLRRTSEIPNDEDLIVRWKELHRVYGETSLGVPLSIRLNAASPSSLITR